MEEEVRVKKLTMQEALDNVRELLGKELKWCLVPIRIEPAVYDRRARRHKSIKYLCLSPLCY